MPENIDLDRRRFLARTAMGAAAAELLMIGSAEARAGGTKQADANTSFGALKQVAAGVLDVGYAEAGPAGGPVAILLHGWPYDIHTYVEVAPLLAAAGYRVIVPYLRGYGTTRFLASETPRNGQQAALAVDIIALMDALGIERRSSPAAIGGRGRPTSSRRSGRSAAGPWSP